VPNAPLNVRSWEQTGKHLLGLSFTGSDPTETFDVTRESAYPGEPVGVVITAPY